MFMTTCRHTFCDLIKTEHAETYPQQIGWNVVFCCFHFKHFLFSLHREMCGHFYLNVVTVWFSFSCQTDAVAANTSIASVQLLVDVKSSTHTLLMRVEKRKKSNGSQMLYCLHMRSCLYQVYLLKYMDDKRKTKHGTLYSLFLLFTTQLSVFVFLFLQFVSDAYITHPRNIIQK